MSTTPAIVFAWLKIVAQGHHSAPSPPHGPHSSRNADVAVGISAATKKGPRNTR